MDSFPTFWSGDPYFFLWRGTLDIMDAASEPFRLRMQGYFYTLLPTWTMLSLRIQSDLPDEDIPLVLFNWAVMAGSPRHYGSAISFQTTN